MKTLSNTLELAIERWDDPGDYPSAAGAGPLPSYNYVAGVDGSIVLELESADFTDMVDLGFLSKEEADAIEETEEIVRSGLSPVVKDYVLEYLECATDALEHVKPTKWEITFNKLQATLEVIEFDSSEKEYDPEEDWGEKEGDWE